MNDHHSSTRFLAVLVFQDGEDWQCEEPRVYEVTHPEIAYQLALADGNEQRYGRTFLGLSHLEETTDDVEPIARSQKGDPYKLVVSKEDMSAFKDPRWHGTSPDEEELSALLKEPDFLMELDGLDDVRWHTLTHAYGQASDVPKDIRRLVSSSSEVRETALWQLFGSIYHQGTLYPATAAATPFILQILSNTILPDRGQISELLESLAESAVVDPAQIEEAWQWRVDNFGEIYALPACEMAAKEIASYQGVKECLNNHMEIIEQLTKDRDVEVVTHAKAALEHILK